jgi:hypothetical protein
MSFIQRVRNVQYKIGEMSGAHSNKRGMIAAYPQLHRQDDRKFLS